MLTRQCELIQRSFRSITFSLHPTLPVQAFKPITMADPLHSSNRSNEAISESNGEILFPVAICHAANEPDEGSQLLLSLEQFQLSCFQPTPAQHFYKFPELPRELRERVYTNALACDLPVSPQLCDNELKFHDENQSEHDAIYQKLGITRVSRKIRDESLPMFYSANTFSLSKDLTTYFDRLENLGRFHMIRHVQLDIYLRRAHTLAAAINLRNMNQFISEADAYEMSLLQSSKEHCEEQEVPIESPSLSSLVGATHDNLTNHPQYLRGGISDLNTLIALRKLSSPFPDGGRTFPHRLVLPVPDVAVFLSWPLLSWFFSAVKALGIHLHFVPDYPVDHFGPSFVRLTWHQKFQKKDFSIGNTAADTGAGEEHPAPADEVKRRTLEIFPDLESMRRARVNSFMRIGCHGKTIKWFDVHTAGGGIP